MYSVLIIQTAIFLLEDENHKCVHIVLLNSQGCTEIRYELRFLAKYCKKLKRGLIDIIFIIPYYERNYFDAPADRR